MCHIKIEWRKQYNNIWAASDINRPNACVCIHVSVDDFDWFWDIQK